MRNQLRQRTRRATDPSSQPHQARITRPYRRHPPAQTRRQCSPLGSEGNEGLFGATVQAIPRSYPHRQ